MVHVTYVMLRSHIIKRLKNINYIDISKSMDKEVSHLSKKNLLEECTFMTKVNYL